MGCRIVVRLGEHDLLKEKDCYTVRDYEMCAEPHVDVLIQRVEIHPRYDEENLHNDIALIRVKRRIQFTSRYRGSREVWMMNELF